MFKKMEQYKTFHTSLNMYNEHGIGEKTKPLMRLSYDMNVQCTSALLHCRKIINKRSQNISACIKQCLLHP